MDFMMRILVLMIISCFVWANSLEFDTLTSEFSQSVRSKNKTITYTGKLVANSKYGAFWHYKKPVEKLIYFNIGRITIIEPSLEQAIITDIKDTPDLRQILKNATKTNKDRFECDIDGVHYTLRVRSGVPAQINYTDKLGNNVTILLKNAKKNQPIDEKLLEPQIPANYDILSE